MYLWKQSRWLQFGVVMAAVVMPSTGNLLASDTSRQSHVIVNDNPSMLPTLLRQSSSYPQINDALQESNQKLKEAIGQVQALADNAKEKKAKQTLYQAIKAAKDLRHAIKAKKLTKAKVSKAMSDIDQIVKKCELDKKHCHTLADLRGKLRQSCKKILAENARPQAFSEPMAITTLPYAITQEGSYYLDKDLDLTDPMVSGAAITVTANNVDIDLRNHTVTVNPNMAALFVQNISNLSVRNGKLLTIAASGHEDSAGTLINGVAHAVFDNIAFLNTRRGAVSTNNQDLTFTSCQFLHPFGEVSAGGRAIEARGTQELHIENCDFGLMGDRAILLSCTESGVAVESAKIRGCKFLGSNIAITLSSTTQSPITNVEIEDCEFQHGNKAAVGISEAKGVEVRHCSFTNQQDGVGILAGQGITVQDCVFDMEGTNPTGIYLFPLESTIQGIKIKDCTCAANSGSAVDMPLISGSPHPSDIVIENCIFTSDCPSGTISVDRASGLVIKDSIIRNGKEDDRSACILLWGSNDSLFKRFNLRAHEVVVDNCLLTGYIGCKLTGAMNCEIKNCTITDGVVGILLNRNATNNVIQNNTIFGNSADGIFVEASSNTNTIIGNRVINNGANGIFVTSSPNVVRGNSVSKNGGDGLLNTGGETNEFFDNSSCNNGGANCTGIPAAIALPPGSPAVVGGNLCCQ